MFKAHETVERRPLTYLVVYPNQTYRVGGEKSAQAKASDEEILEMLLVGEKPDTCIAKVEVCEHITPLARHNYVYVRHLDVEHPRYLGFDIDLSQYRRVNHQ